MDSVDLPDPDVPAMRTTKGRRRSTRAHARARSAGERRGVGVGVAAGPPSSAPVGAWTPPRRADPTAAVTRALNADRPMRAVVMVFASAAGVADASWLRRRKTSLVAWR